MIISLATKMSIVKIFIVKNLFLKTIEINKNNINIKIDLIKEDITILL